MKSKTKIDKIFDEVQRCKNRKNCYGSDSIKIFVPTPAKEFGRKKVKILFVNERPGYKGTIKSGRVDPNNNDPTAKRFRMLFEQLNVCKQKIFSTNACLCYPCENYTKNKTPSAKQVKNCSEWLKKQVNILAPKLIVTLGNWGRKALCYCLEKSETLNELKKFRLSANIGRDFKSDKFVVYPLYHTSPRTLGRRNNEKQKKDWIKIKEILKNQ